MWPGFKYRRRRHMWVFLLVFSFAQSSHVVSSPIMESEARRERTREIEAEEKESSPSLSPPLALASPFACCSRGLLATPPNVEFAPRLCSERFFSAYSRFSTLLKNQHFQIPIRPGITDEELLCGCATSKPLFLFFNFLLIVLLHATHLKSPFFPFISTYHRYKTIMNKTLNMINLLK